MRLWIVVAAVNGFLSVALGAHAAHSLEGRVEAQALDWIDTAARYEAIHALALLGVASRSFIAWSSFSHTISRVPFSAP